jgi:hypothetical protein
MPVATAIKNARTLVASASNAAGATTRGTLDVRTALGGIVTLRITNGATGPTAQCEGRILIAHNSGATPAAASAGADWKTVWVFGGGTAANSVIEQSWTFGPEVMHVEVEFTGNTGQAVTVEAFASEFTSSDIT